MYFEVSPHSGPKTSVLKRFNFRRKQETWIPSIHTVLICGGKPLEGDTSACHQVAGHVKFTTQAVEIAAQLRPEILQLSQQ